MAIALRLARPRLQQNWLTLTDLRNLVRLAGFEIVRTGQEMLSPIWFPVLSWVLNKWVVKVPPFGHLALTNVVVSRAVPATDGNAALSVSVVVAARNEAGNVEAIFRRLPAMGRSTELVIVEGGSTDNTYAEIERCTTMFPQVNCRYGKQKGHGKGDAVRHGFELASGDVFMILDADLTVAPEDLPRFYRAVASGQCEFANGVRLVYPMERHAMRFANLVGNKFFSLAFSWLLGQQVRDTLCGTKVLRREDYLEIARNRRHFGDFDPFGDFDLLFGAARLGLKMVDVPVRYHDRVYGSTNIQRWRHGLILLRMVVFGGRKLRFV